MKQHYSSWQRARQWATPALLALLLGTQLGARAQSTVNPGIQFNGTSKYGNSNSAVNLSGAAVSIEAWVRFASFKIITPFVSSIAGIEPYGTTAEGAYLRAGDTNQPANQLQFVLKLGTAPVKLSSPTPLLVNTWYHVAGVYDGTTMKLYLNGVLDCSQAATGSVVANSTFSIGRTFEQIRTLDGAVDEVRVWTRALTAAEVLANRCQPSSSNTTGLRGWWRLDENSGSIAYDQSGFNSNINLVGVTATDWITNTTAVCARPLAAASPTAATGLRLVPLENPTTAAVAEAELHGAPNQPVQLELLNALGQLVATSTLRPRAETERIALPLPGAPGLYVLRASTPGGSTTTRLLKR